MVSRDKIAIAGGKTVMLRPDVVERVDELARFVDLLGSQGLLKGQPDRPALIDAVIALVGEDRALVERLRRRVAPMVEERRQREEDKAARRARSGGKRGRPPNRPREVSA